MRQKALLNQNKEVHIICTVQQQRNHWLIYYWTQV